LGNKFLKKNRPRSLSIYSRGIRSLCAWH